MCSMVAIYVNELNLIIFMVYRPPPNHKNHFHWEVLVKSFKEIVLDNIYKVIGGYNTPVLDIILAGDFNFPKAHWNAGLGTVKPGGTCNDISLRQLNDVASDLNPLWLKTL